MNADIEEFHEAEYKVLSASTTIWQPPLPDNPAFVERTRAILAQARIEAQTLIDENKVEISFGGGYALSSRVEKSTLVNREYKTGPMPLIGNCQCGFSKYEFTKGCEHCYQRHMHRWKRHRIPKPILIDRSTIKPSTISDIIERDKIKRFRRVNELCAGCGVPWADFTPDCWNCKSRHNNRRKAEAQTPLPWWRVT